MDSAAFCTCVSRCHQMVMFHSSIVSHYAGSLSCCLAYRVGRPGLDSLCWQQLAAMSNNSHICKSLTVW